MRLALNSQISAGLCLQVLVLTVCAVMLGQTLGLSGSDKLPLFSCRCFSEESCVSIPEVEGYVVVLQPDAPQILLSGTAHFARPAVDFEGPEGVPLFPDLQITCSISHQVETKADESWQGTGRDNPKE